MHIRELLTVDRQLSRSKAKSKFMPTTRNETIKMMTECPASTSNRIVFLPNMNGVGFRCKLSSNQSVAHESLNEDEKLIEKLPLAIKEEMIRGIRTVNDHCYQTWKEIKYERQNFPLEKEKSLFMASVVLSVFVISLFFVTSSDQSARFWLVLSCFGMLAIIYMLVVVAAIMVCCKRTSNDNLDAKVSESITLQLKRLNETSRCGLVWRNPKNQVWIYATVPQDRL